MSMPGQVLRLVRFRLLRRANVQLHDLRVGVAWSNRFETDRNSTISLGQHVILGRATSMVAHAGPERPGRIVLGASVHVGDYSLLLASGCDVTIGEQSVLAQFTKLIGINHRFKEKGTLIREQGLDRERAGITIGRDCWLGAGACVLPGVSIGDGVVVGAMSVVTRSVPPYQIVAGNPARVIGERQ